MNADEKKRVMHDDFKIQITEELNMEVSDMCNLSQEIKFEGRIEGKVETLLELVKEGLLSIANAAAKLGMSEEEFRNTYHIV